ncbi:hypothetical protein LMJF_11_0340 [Leishmania major strain Friedlin]|uniref:Uncharacterized protein n=1 Tax=Leishmania major TaxID=5664 RepID=Q4QH46_LEIMA|nr:hypothetical protein LMJF_11_0340 [Leishmania major strain Friedlin]CAG9570156.1 hypothetical_protein_-_conserved [Leishmania major strain Friedlin]CAJ02489.1 hypothetical protein LMJF_11_0340 [Leishmania major strain Friedlin]|eukprot:XP_001681502.1 hypothetical protein LMJF_11_0340 [Leishmania major strain Friedlin]
MVYKRKRQSKKARRTPARKLPKAVEAAAVAAALVPVGGADEGAAVQRCDAGFSSALSTDDRAISCAPVTINGTCGNAAAAESPTEANVGSAHKEMPQEQQSEKPQQQQQQPGTSGYQCCSDTSGLLYSAPPTPADLARLSVASSAGLPSVLAATHLPCIPGVASCSPQCGEDGSGEGHYVAYLLSEQLSNNTTMPMTMWGVYSLRSGDCLQVVRWHHSPAAHASPVTNGALHPSSTTPQAQQTKELIMRVDATGLCFMLAPSSLVSVEGGGAAGCMTPASVSSEPDAAAAGAAASGDVYWLIPSMMKESFLALLQAQEWLRTAPPRHPASDTCVRRFECQGWCVQPHPTRWASVTPSLKATASAAEAWEPRESPSPPTAALPAPRRTAQKAKRRRGSPSPRAQPPQQQPSIMAAAAAAPLQNTASTTRSRLALADATPSSPSHYRIPYVAAVPQLQKRCSGATASHLPLTAGPAAAVTPVVLLLGNRIAPYPADGACGAKT